MLTTFFDVPWVALALLAALGVLWLAAWRRIRREARFRRRARVDRRGLRRNGRDRRWNPRAPGT